MDKEKKVMEMIEEKELPSLLYDSLILPDELFEQLQEVLLENLQAELSNPQTKMLMLTEVYGENITQEKLEKQYMEFLEMISEDEELPDNRKAFLTTFIFMIYNAYVDVLRGNIHSKEILVEFCRDRDGLPTPRYMTEGSSGMDVYALDNYEILPGQSVLIPTGLKVAIPQGYELQVRDKSGIALKTKLRVANAPGTIDADYRGEIGVIIENIEAPIADIGYEFTDEGLPIITSIEHGKPYIIEKGSRFAQLVLTQILQANWVPVQSVEESATERQEGGFGSTGLK